ncbi:hypothetical protein CEE44_04750 [Candidatus Woesearchaeota archaeon B3_Woes]|nr:MAG: hypothetical protein CEE44_04750 [Candidatus Woesearchaeota archaeon B3_Woes]
MKSGEEFQVNLLKKMIRFIVLLSLETKVRKATKGKDNSLKRGDHKIVQREYDQLVAETEPYKRAMPERSPLGKRMRVGVRNVKNIARNIHANTYGNLSVYRQDSQTKSHYKKNPRSKEPMAHITPGFGMTRGSMYKLGKEFRKEGYRPVFHKGHHFLSEKEGAEKGFRKMRKLHRYTKLEDIPNRNDIMIGHSSGGNRVRYMARDKRIKKYGIKKAYAIAPTPTGFKPQTLGQRLLAPLIGKEDIRYEKGQRTALELSGTKPEISTYNISGKEDGLVPPKIAADKDAEEHYVVEGPDSTHFGTSGATPRINELLVDLVKNQSKPRYRRYKRKENVLKKEVTGQPRYYKDAA